MGIIVLSQLGVIDGSEGSLQLKNCDLTKFLNRLIYPVLKQYQTMLNHLGKWGIEPGQDAKQLLENIRKKTDGLSLAYPLCVHLQNMKTYQNILDLCLLKTAIKKTSNGWEVSAEKLSRISDFLNKLVIGIESFDTTIRMENGSYTIFKTQSKF